MLAVVLVPSLSRKLPNEQVVTERRAPDDGMRIRAMTPEDGMLVRSTDVRFVWGAVPAATYELTLTDAEGRTVWHAATTDTTLILPRTARLSGPASYYWNVDALAPDGSSLTTGIREFKVPAR